MSPSLVVIGRNTSPFLPLYTSEYTSENNKRLSLQDFRHWCSVLNALLRYTSATNPQETARMRETGNFERSYDRSSQYAAHGSRGFRAKGTLWWGYFVAWCPGRGALRRLYSHVFWVSHGSSSITWDSQRFISQETYRHKAYDILEPLTLTWGWISVSYNLSVTTIVESPEKTAYVRNEYILTWP